MVKRLAVAVAGGLLAGVSMVLAIALLREAVTYGTWTYGVAAGVSVIVFLFSVDLLTSPNHAPTTPPDDELV